MCLGKHKYVATFTSFVGSANRGFSYEYDTFQKAAAHVVSIRKQTADIHRERYRTVRPRLNRKYRNGPYSTVKITRTCL